MVLITQALYISEKTVKNNITNILSRLNLRDRTQLAIIALQQGLGGKQL
ncbi:MAG: response regulator transcription factor [Elainella sp. C42_A2020_010]|nr:response regulator transcription factor [Elainella sp. C42_A2020_010]